MTELYKIIENCSILKVIGNVQIWVNSLQFDSRKVQKNDLFFAVRGTTVDGHDYIDKAIEQGARVIVCENITNDINPDITYIKVQDSSISMAYMTANFFGNPTKKLKIIGVTGTNGKTTIATLLYLLFNKLGKKSGLLSTISYNIGNKKIDASHTTPDAMRMQEYFAEMANEGCEYCFMEVSSHAIVQNRVAGIDYAAGIYSNLTHDHLDYHKTFDEYIKAKKLFFDGLSKEACAITNIDDKNGRVMVQNTGASIKAYSLNAMCDFKARIIETHLDGTLVDFNGTEFWTPFIGIFNIYNLLAVYACTMQFGFDNDEVIREISALKPVEGRFEYIKSDDGKIAIVDYAHTPDALVNVLNAINEIRKGEEKLITVVGAGGNRDKLKRPKMAVAAINNSDKVIYTSDNPRDEEPDDIINDMIAGVDKNDKGRYLAITNRKEAIKTAIMLAEKGDIILVAGKGHETYQEIKGERFHFDDREVIREIFEGSK